jgi:hypothetical protein
MAKTSRGRRGSSYVNARRLLLETLERREVLDATYHSLKNLGTFTQDWTDTSKITADNNWSGVPSIEGYDGVGLTTQNDVDPQTLLGMNGNLWVKANMTTVTAAPVGVGEVELATNPTIAIAGGLIQKAPFLLFRVDATARSDIRIQYNLRDIDVNRDGIMRVALQYRVGETGNFTNVVAGFVADASNTSATLVTARNVVLPAAANNQPKVQIRILTTDNTGSTDEWIGVDDIVISGTAVNAPPVLTLPGGPLAYVENAAATPIQASATVSDSDSSDFNTGTLTVTLAAGGSVDDRLAIRHQGSAAGEIGVAGNTVSYGGAAIGTFTGGDGTTPLVITFNTAAATPAAVEALVRNVTYRNVSEQPTTTPRTVTFVVSDGDGGTSAAANAAVNVSAVNDPPILTFPSPPAHYLAGSAAVVIDAGATITDADTTLLANGGFSVTIDNAQLGDQVSILSEGTVSVAGSEISFNGTVVGHVVPASFGLVVDFNGAASLPAVEALLRRLTFQAAASSTGSTRALSIDFVEADNRSSLATAEVVVAALPHLMVFNASITEGNSGSQLLSFAVTLFAAPTSDLTVTLATQNDTATGADFGATTGNLVFTPTGPLTQSFNVSITGDVRFEANEQFFVNVVSAVGAIIDWGQAVGTILNDDARPTVTIAPASRLEGITGTAALDFQVSLSNPSDEAVTVTYSTADGTAKLVNGDYVSATGAITFAAGTEQLAQTIAINVKGDRDIELDETFTLQATLSGAANASAQGLGTILNDDFLVAVIVNANLSASNGANNGQADTFRLVRNGVFLDTYVNAALDQSYYLPNVVSVDVQGSTDDDQIIVDYGNGAWSVPGGITLAGNALGGVAVDNDQLLVIGTADDDELEFQQTSTTHAEIVLNGNAQALTIASMEGVRVEAGAGADEITMAIDDSLAVAPGGALPVTVVGGDQPGADDRLVIVDTGLADLVLHRPGGVLGTGDVHVGPANEKTFSVAYIGMESVAFVDAAGTTIDRRTITLNSDSHEPNNSVASATNVALGTSLSATIEAGDSDYYRVAATVTGVLDLKVQFDRVASVAESGRPGLPGNGDLDLELYDHTRARIVPTAPFGTNDTDDDERIRIPAVQGEVYYLRVFGHAANTENSYTMLATNAAAPIPAQLSFVASPGAPAGVSRDDTPTISLQLDEALLRDTVGTPFDEVISIPYQGAALAAGYRIALFDEGATAPLPGSAPPVVAGYATATATPGEYVFTFATPLSPGRHFLTARVEMMDPAVSLQAGFGERSAALEIFVDNSAPEVSFGEDVEFTDGLDVASDSGALDRITSDATPTFWGRSEPDAIVRLFADTNGDGAFDAADAVLAEVITGATGRWQATLTSSLASGMHFFFVTATDAAGNSNALDALDAFVDTQSPVVLSAAATTLATIAIQVRDLGPRAANFLFDAVDTSVLSPAMFTLQRQASGSTVINSVSFQRTLLVAGQSAEGTIRLHLAAPLADDRYELTIDAALADVAGNTLSSDFTSQFVIDKRAELGVRLPNSIVIDANENGTPDPGATPNQAGSDVSYALTSASEISFSGNFSLFADGQTDGIDKLASYGVVNGQYRFAIDVDHDGVIDNNPGVVPDAGTLTILNVAGQPLTGRFNDSDADGDEVAVFDGTAWHFDTNHNFVIDSDDLTLVSALRGTAVVGDFDGDGFDDLATWSAGSFAFDLSQGARRGWDGTVDLVVKFDVGGSLQQPVVADMDGDGIDDLGLWTPDRSASQTQAEWRFITSGGHPLVSTTLAPDSPGHRVHSDGSGGLTFIFSPSPAGQDHYFEYGSTAGLPVVGNFIRPTVPLPGVEVGRYRNEALPRDVNGDRGVNALDAALVITNLNAAGVRTLTSTMRSVNGPFLDVSGDQAITPLDALLIIIQLNAIGPTQGEAPMENAVPESPARDADDATPVSVAWLLTAQAWSMNGEHDQDESDRDDLDRLAEDVSPYWRP